MFRNPDVRGICYRYLIINPYNEKNIEASQEMKAEDSNESQRKSKEIVN